MKSNLEIPDDQYRYWLGEVSPPEAEPSVEVWLADWIALGEQTLGEAPSGPTATEILDQDRSRLDRAAGLTPSDWLEAAGR